MFAIFAQLAGELAMAMRLDDRPGMARTPLPIFKSPRSMMIPVYSPERTSIPYVS